MQNNSKLPKGNGIETVAIMDKDFLSINQKYFSGRTNEKSATKLDSIKNDSSKKVVAQNKRANLEHLNANRIQKSIDSDENNGLIQAFTELVSLGYNRTFENFKIHHVSNQNHLIDKEIAKTKKFLAKKTKCTN